MPGFEVRLVRIAPGCARAYCEADWRDALVLVERGDIELRLRGGASARFRHGDVLCLAGLPVSAVYNPGGEAALLAAVSRL